MNAAASFKNTTEAPTEATIVPRRVALRRVAAAAPRLGPGLCMWGLFRDDLQVKRRSESNFSLAMSPHSQISTKILFVFKFAVRHTKIVKCLTLKL